LRSFGTPVRDPNDPAKILYQSGTEQEVEEALKAGREVLVYFRGGQPPMPDSDEDVAEVLAQRQKGQSVSYAPRGWRPRHQRLSGCRRLQAQAGAAPGPASDADPRHLDRAGTPSGSGARASLERRPLSLRSLDSDEAPIFFGRNDETAELVRWVAEESRQFVAVIGVSGAENRRWLRPVWCRHFRSGRA